MNEPEPGTLSHETRQHLGDLCLGVVLSLLGGSAVLGLSSQWGSYGYVFVFGVPVTMGAVLGYTTNLPRGTRAFAGLFLVVAVIGGAITGGLAGSLCGVVAATILLLPTLLGVLLGSILRKRLVDRGVPPHATAASLLLIATCAGLALLESHIEPSHPEETIVTERVVDMTADRAFEVLRFYEQVDLDPPLFASIGLPHPLGTEGKIRGVGDVKRCLYSSGYLKKRITRYEPGRRLAFDVVEQVGIEDRSVELLSGSFAFQGLPDGRTRITLTTVYRPLLAARPVWRPFEQSLAHILHEHVLDGMEREDELARRVASGSRPGEPPRS